MTKRDRKSAASLADQALVLFRLDRRRGISRYFIPLVTAGMLGVVIRTSLTTPLPRGLLNYDLLLLLATATAGVLVRLMIITVVSKRTPPEHGYGTLLVNVIGCVIYAGFWVMSAHMPVHREALAWLLLHGFAGAVTTFSSFAFEGVEMLRARRFSRFGVYVGTQVLFGAAVIAAVLYSEGWHQRPLFPWATAWVNISGCFLFGLVWSLSRDHRIISVEERTVLLTGFLGGFTTFSSVMAETAQFLLSGAWQLGLANLVLQGGLGFVAAWLGLKILPPRKAVR